MGARMDQITRESVFDNLFLAIKEHFSLVCHVEKKRAIVDGEPRKQIIITMRRSGHKFKSHVCDKDNNTEDENFGTEKTVKFKAKSGINYKRGAAKRRP